MSQLTDRQLFILRSQLCYESVNILLAFQQLADTISKKSDEVEELTENEDGTISIGDGLSLGYIACAASIERVIDGFVNG